MWSAAPSSPAEKGRNKCLGMNIEERINRYKQIEDVRRRPLIVYATSTRFGVRAQMARDAVREFIDQIDAIPNSEESVDVLIHSPGGDGLTAWKLMSLLRERFKSIGVLVPFEAFSAATIFALGADEIVMHPHASLGPIDPQITTKSPDGKQMQFSYEDLGAFLRFLRQEAALRRQDVQPVAAFFAGSKWEKCTDSDSAIEHTTKYTAATYSAHLTTGRGPSLK
jgi:ClpP class serine protease